VDAFQIGLSSLCGLLAVLLVVDIVRDQQNTNHSFWGLVAIEAGLVVQFFWGLVRLIADGDGVDAAPYVGYLVGALVILPIAFLWSASEKSRSGTAVVLVAVLVVPVLLLRLHDLWALGG
jgi:hypothetical protein